MTTRRSHFRVYEVFFFLLSRVFSARPPGASVFEGSLTLLVKGWVSHSCFRQVRSLERPSAWTDRLQRKDNQSRLQHLKPHSPLPSQPRNHQSVWFFSHCVGKPVCDFLSVGFKERLPGAGKERLCVAAHSSSTELRNTVFRVLK